jgi:hypothetical protein
MLRKLHPQLSLGFFVFFLTFFVIYQSFAQSEVNPFDIGSPALKSSDSTNTTAPTNTTINSNVSDNPFDIIEVNPSQNNVTPIAPIEIKVTPIKTAERPQQFLFGLVLTILLLLTVLVSLSRNLIGKIYQAFFNDIVLKALHRERGSLNTTVYVGLYSMFIINLGVFVYLLLRYYGYLFHGSDFLTLLYCILGIAGLIISKHIVLSILAYIFPIEKEINTYSFIILIFGVLIGLVLAPVNVFFAYSDTKMAEYIVLGMVGFLGLAYFLCAMRSLFLARSYIFPHFFHFLLYLCSVEIVPLLLLYKSVSSKL